jgi:pimeloyl-ACP methyl ester carboxylesterase
MVRVTHGLEWVASPEVAPSVVLLHGLFSDTRIWDAVTPPLGREVV